jgi:ribosomal protein L2
VVAGDADSDTDRIMTRSNKSLVLYRHTCRKCRFLSRLIDLLSGHMIERIPIDSARAAQIIAVFPEARGRLMLLTPQGVTVGRPVIPTAVLLVLRAWFTTNAPR